MPTVPAGIMAKLNRGLATLAEAFWVEPIGSSPIGFTRYDEDITFSSRLYRRLPGAILTRTSNSIGINTEIADASGIFHPDWITEEDLFGGKFEDAPFERALIDPEEPELGRVVMQTGTIGLPSFKDKTWTMELRPLGASLQDGAGDVSGPQCRAIRLGDGAECTVNLAGTSPLGPAYRSGAVAVGTLESEVTFLVSAGFFPSIWFLDGMCLFTAGKNVGREIGIAFHESLGGGSHRVTLQEPPPYALASGSHSVRLECGCRRTFNQCNLQFSQKYNHRGESYMIGDAEYYKTV